MSYNIKYVVWMQVKLLVGIEQGDQYQMMSSSLRTDNATADGGMRRGGAMEGCGVAARRRYAEGALAAGDRRDEDRPLKLHAGGEG